PESAALAGRFRTHDGTRQGSCMNTEKRIRDAAATSEPTRERRPNGRQPGWAIALGRLLQLVSDLSDHVVGLQHEDLNHAGVHHIIIRSVEVARRTAHAYDVAELTCGAPGAALRTLWPFLPAQERAQTRAQQGSGT